MNLLAKSGDRYAQYLMGKLWRDGPLLTPDWVNARYWFQKSAEQGHPYAQYMLGKLYLMGQGVEYDKELGAYWLNRASEQGNVYAEALLQHQDSGRPPHVFLGVTRLLHHMSRIFQERSLPQSGPGGIQIDRKRLAQLQEKREAHGLKGNVYEEYKGPTISV